MPKLFISIFLFSILYLAGTFNVDACSCAGRPRGVKGVQTCSYYWGSENVFIGRAEKITIEDGQMKVSFAVEKPIRGTTEKTIEIFTSVSTASCGYPFKEGERYFVYGRKRSDEKFHESLCGPTTLLKDAEDDLQYAGEIESGKTGSRIFGNVYEDKQDTYADKRTFERLADIEITIKGEKKKNTFKTKTDEKGFYIFKEIPEDSYRVTAKLPAGLREIFAREDLTEHFAGVNLSGTRCDGESFTATRQGSIRGKIIGHDGKEAPQLFLSLLPLDENNRVDESSPFKALWADKMSGEFYFNTVPGGKYLLAVNPQNCPLQQTHNILRQKDLEFGRVFFNGSADASESKIITVGTSQQIKLEDFRILPPLKERLFSGIVLSADKNPLAGATVFMLVKDSQKCSIFSAVSEVKTDESGRFQLKGFETYDYKIRAYIEIDNQKNARLFSKIFEIPLEGNMENIELIVDSTY